jgi:hypothetical protein
MWASDWGLREHEYLANSHGLEPNQYFAKLDADIMQDYHALQSVILGAAGIIYAVLNGYDLLIFTDEGSA